jgi:DNA-directed RNA polymerase subunit F
VLPELSVEQMTLLRSKALESLTFAEAFAGVKRSARWSDVRSAAEKLASCIKDARFNDGEKASVVARKVAQVAPSVALEFRVALASYAAAKQGANAQQLAELAATLPELKTVGALRDKALTFGGIVLPPIVGELN